MGKQALSQTILVETETVKTFWRFNFSFNQSNKNEHIHSNRTSRHITKKYMHKDMYSRFFTATKEKSLNTHLEGNGLLNYGTAIKYKIIHLIKIGKNRKLILTTLSKYLKEHILTL